MTKVSIRENEEVVEIVIDGHSGYAEEGKDIVCAGISTLSHAWNKLCVELMKQNKITINSLFVSDGHSEITITDPMGYTMYALQMQKIGYRALMENYPENISFYGGEI